MKVKFTKSEAKFLSDSMRMCMKTDLLESTRGMDDITVLNNFVLTEQLAVLEFAWPITRFILKNAAVIAAWSFGGEVAGRALGMSDAQEALKKNEDLQKQLDAIQAQQDKIAGESSLKHLIVQAVKNLRDSLAVKFDALTNSPKPPTLDKQTFSYASGMCANVTTALLLFAFTAAGAVVIRMIGALVMRIVNWMKDIFYKKPQEAKAFADQVNNIKSKTVKKVQEGFDCGGNKGDQNYWDWKEPHKNKYTGNKKVKDKTTRLRKEEKEEEKK